MLRLACAEFSRNIETFGIGNLIGLRQTQSDMRELFYIIAVKTSYFKLRIAISFFRSLFLDNT